MSNYDAQANTAWNTATVAIANALLANTLAGVAILIAVAFAILYPFVWIGTRIAGH